MQVPKDALLLRVFPGGRSTNEIHQLEKPSKRQPWRLLVVHRLWWAADRRKAIRNIRWAHVEQGNQRDILAWFAARELQDANGPADEEKKVNHKAHKDAQRERRALRPHEVGFRQDGCR